jgi:hypothetical protein
VDVDVVLDVAVEVDVVARGRRHIFVNEGVYVHVQGHV